MSFIRPALVLFILLTLLTGGVYPLLTTALGQWWFPQQANGSLIRIGGEVRGSSLIGQNFTAAGYFSGRPSATAETPLIRSPPAAVIWPPATRRWIRPSANACRRYCPRQPGS